MRITIESEEKPTVAAAAVTATEPSQIESINAGPPAASLLQSVSVTGMPLAETSNFREGTDAGAPPAALVQALQGVASSAENTAASEDSNAGSAPSA